MPDVIANKYEIVREIARSNDVVYEAIDRTMGRRLAVKELVIPPNLTGQARRERIERFNREARATGRLAHPNIVTVFDFGEFDGRYFIAMEFLEGQTLRDVLQTRGSLPLAEAVDTASQVLSALSHAHAHRVIHRDVKPDNIHILPGGQIKLTDFGIARLTEEASLTGEGQVFGTPSYMSPEQIEGRFVDHRTDLFSLAVVLYEMLAGRKPFTGDSVVSITYSIMHAEPAPLAGVPYGVEQVIFRDLQKDPGRRHPSAEEMRQALKSADQTPAIFLSPSTSLTGMGYGGLSSPAGPGVPGGHTGGYGAGGLPPAAGPLAGVPPTGGTAYGTPAGAPVPAQPASGPFVNWGQTIAPNAPGYTPPPPPPFVRRQGPLISPAVRSFAAVFLWVLVLSAAISGFVLLFVNAYDQQQKHGAEVAAQRLMAEGKRRFEAGDLAGAASLYEQAVKAAPASAVAPLARHDLAVVYNQLGIRAFELRDYSAAEDYFNRAVDADPSLQDAYYNLSRVYDVGNDPQRAADMLERGREAGRVGDTSPGAPGDTTPLQQRYARAREMLQAGAEAYRQGNVQTARDYWQKVIAEAPGTDAAQQAQEYLDQTTSPPSF